MYEDFHLASRRPAFAVARFDRPCVCALACEPLQLPASLLPFAARHTAAATDCEYDVAWAQSYAIGVDYTPSTTRAGNAVFNRRVIGPENRYVLSEVWRGTAALESHFA
jgi:hypothetical protein